MTTPGATAIVDLSRRCRSPSDARRGASIPVQVSKSVAEIGEVHNVISLTRHAPCPRGGGCEYGVEIVEFAEGKRNLILQTAVIHIDFEQAVTLCRQLHPSFACNLLVAYFISAKVR